MEILNCVLAEWKAGQSRLSKYRIGATIMMSLVYQINKKKKPTVKLLSDVI